MISFNRLYQGDKKDSNFRLQPTKVSNIYKINDLKVGMILPGIVTNITNFGAFVDIGVKQDGLIHLSNLTDDYIENPADFLKLNQYVKVKVITLEINRKRIGLSMKDVK